MSQVLVRAVRLSAGFWRDPRGTTRRWRAEGIAPGRVEIDPPAPGTFKLYLLPDPIGPDAPWRAGGTPPNRTGCRFAYSNPGEIGR